MFRRLSRTIEMIDDILEDDRKRLSLGIISVGVGVSFIASAVLLKKNIVVEDNIVEKEIV